VRVLIVEDERKLAQVLSSALQAEHYDVVVAATGEDGFYRANAELFDLVVLDLMLPGRSGLEILQTLRQRHVETPVLILTARDGSTADTDCPVVPCVAVLGTARLFNAIPAQRWRMAAASTPGGTRFP
jgi:CheY-like chemotaxis protein